MPAAPGRGSAYKYVPDTAPDSRFSRAGAPQSRAAQAKAAMSARFNESRPGQGSGENTAIFVPSVTAPEDADEASKIAAMFQATSEQWSHAQERMAHATFRGIPGRGGMRGGRGGAVSGPGRNDAPGRGLPPPGPVRHHEPPGAGYVCHRCGKKGHWIQDCPTNDMPDWQNKPKLKRTTGIPRSMLKTIENPTDEQRAAGVMITADGDFVIPQADTATWEKEKGKHKILTKNDVYEMAPSDPGLTCSLCSRLVRDAMETPCCHTRYCEECITTHLLDHDFACPECDTRIDDFDQLVRDEETQGKVRQYIDDEIAKSEQAHDKDREEGDEAAQAEAEEGPGQRIDLDAAPSEGPLAPTARDYGGVDADAKARTAERMWAGGVPYALMMQLLMARLAQQAKDPGQPDASRVQAIAALKMMQLQIVQSQQQAAQAQQAAMHASSRWGASHGGGGGGGPSGGGYGPDRNGAGVTGSRWGQAKRERPADFLEVPRASKRGR